MDDLVKDYLLFRGFNATLKTLENELKNDKEKGFRVDRVIELFNIYIGSYDLASLREYWHYLDRRLFCRLEQAYMSSLRKLEVSLLKLYVVNAAQNNRPDKVTEFFERMAGELQSQVEWKDWFALPFIKNPEETPQFAVYFSRQWQETFFLSFHNFLGIVFQSMPRPSIMQFEVDQRRIQDLEKENTMYKKQIASLLEKRELEQKLQFSQRNSEPSPVATPGAASVDIIDDFYVISQDTSIPEKDSSKSSQIKSFIKGLGSSNTTPKRTPPATKRSIWTKEEPPRVKQDVHIPAQPKKTPSPKLRLKQETEATGSPPAEQQVAPADGGAPTVLPSGGDRLSERLDSDRSSPGGEALSPATTSMSKDKPPDMVKLPALAEPPRGSAQTSQKAAPPGVASRDQTSTNPAPQPGVQDTRTPESHAEVTSSLIPLGQEEYSEHHGSISHCRFSSRGHLVATADVDGIVKIWSLQPSPITMATIMSKSMFLSIDWLTKVEHLILLGNKLGCVKLFDVKQKKVVGEVNTEPSFQRIVSVACSPDGKSFACSAAGKSKLGQTSPETSLPRLGKLMVCDLGSMTIKRSLPLPNSQPSMLCTAYSSTGQLLLTGGADGTISIYDAEHSKCVASWPAHQGEVYTVHIKPDASSCYSMGSDGKFCEWSLHKPGQRLADLGVHQGACGPFVLSAPGGYRQVQTPKGKLFAFDGDNQYVLTCAQTSGLIYKVENGGLQRTLTLGGHRTPLTCVDWSSSMDSRMCLTASMDGKVKVSTLLTK